MRENIELMHRATKLASYKSIGTYNYCQTVCSINKSLQQYHVLAKIPNIVISPPVIMQPGPHVGMQ